MKKITLLILVLFTATIGYGDIRLPKILGDNMVLQRNKPINIWGWADPGEKVIVQFNKQTKSTKADPSGKWIAILAAETAGGPFLLTIKGKNTISFSNILVGEVWVCSGQSNMEWPLRSANNSAEEIRQANYPEIRHFAISRIVSRSMRM